MIRYPLDGESLMSATIHAGMLASQEARSTGCTPSFVVVCKDCGEPIGEHGTGARYGRNGCPLTPQQVAPRKGKL